MLYTRSGDQGKTSFFGGERGFKDDPRIEAYGTVDELNSALGVAIAFADNKEIKNLLQHIQNDLFSVTAELASLSASVPQPSAAINKDHVTELEQHISRLERQLPPQKNFILPGGTRLGALLHLSRTVARRAERRVVTLSKPRRINPDLMHYINRISDLLHILSRLANKAQDEIPPVYDHATLQHEQKALDETQ